MEVNNIKSYTYQSLYNMPKLTFCNKSCVKKVLDIKARGAYPACTLSNLADTSFTLDGVRINSMEGFLQSLKVSDSEKQKEICALSGFDAKKLSKSLKQSKEDILFFWDGKSFKKNSDEFKTLISDVINTYKTAGTKPFHYKDYSIQSVNTFISSLKSKDIDTQKTISAMTENEITTKLNEMPLSYSPRTLHWQGKSFKRDSKEYSNLLNRAYEARYNADDKFRQAIFDTKDTELTHNKGSNDPNNTILTTQEFLKNLKVLRKHIK